MLFTVFTPTFNWRRTLLRPRLALWLRDRLTQE